jgi:hypothetical protein
LCLVARLLVAVACAMQGFSFGGFPVVWLLRHGCLGCAPSCFWHVSMMTRVIKVYVFMSSGAVVCVFFSNNLATTGAWATQNSTWWWYESKVPPLTPPFHLIDKRISVTRCRFPVLTRFYGIRRLCVESVFFCKLLDNTTDCSSQSLTQNA